MKKEGNVKDTTERLREEKVMGEINKEMLILSKLEEFANRKLVKLENKIKQQDTKAIIYIYGDDNENAIKEKLEILRSFCKKNRINVVQEIVNESLVKTYHTRDFEQLLYNVYTNKINTIVLENLYDMGDDSLVNTFIINEIFTKYNTRFIALKQRVDTNFDDTLVNYENPVYVQLMDFIEMEEKRMNSRKIKLNKELKNRNK